MSSRHEPRDVIDRLNRGESVDPSSYYFRTTPYFETSSENYAWLNRICAIATGSRAGDFGLLAAKSHETIENHNRHDVSRPDAASEIQLGKTVGRAIAQAPPQ